MVVGEVAPSDGSGGGGGSDVDGRRSCDGAGLLALRRRSRLQIHGGELERAIWWVEEDDAASW